MPHHPQHGGDEAIAVFALILIVFLTFAYFH